MRLRRGHALVGLALAIPALLALTAAACGPRAQEVVGTLVDVQATSVVEISSFSIEAPDRGRLDFTVRGDVGFSASHLREHMLGGERVKVTYVREGNGLRALRVEDAP